MKVSQTKIIDCRCETEQFVTANLLEDPPDDVVISAGRIWTKYKNRLGMKTDHTHWNWEGKLLHEHKTNSTFRVYVVEYEQSVQGIILLNVGYKHVCHLPEQKGERLVYVQYIEAAPWNIPFLAKRKQFKYAGTRLLQTAVQFSIEMGYNGRIGLHSLPSAESYYANKVGMRQTQRIAMKDTLNYFELSKYQVDTFLGEI